MDIVTFTDRIKALLNKIGSYLIDPRTYGVIFAIWMSLKMLNIFQSEIDEAAVQGVLKAGAEVFFAVANLLAVLVPIIKWISGITQRPPRGIGPWLPDIMAEKARSGNAPKG